MGEGLSLIEKKCLEKGMKMTDQRRVVAHVLSVSTDHPDVEAVYRRSLEIDNNISIATVYRTIRLFKEANILESHDFRDGRSRYEIARDSHHDHLIDLKSGKVIEFADEELDRLKKEIALRCGYKLIDYRLELFGVPLDSDNKSAEE